MSNPSTNIESRYNRRLIKSLITPSWLSGLVAILLALAVTIGVIVVFSFNNSLIRQQLLIFQNLQPLPTLTQPGGIAQTPTNSLQTTWPLIVFWGVVGLVFYFVVETITKVVRNVQELRRELDYVNVRRDSIIRSEVRFLAIRVVIVVFWIIFSAFFFKYIIPYSIMASYASASNPKSVDGILYALVSLFIIGLSLHIHTIFLRSALGRPRIFSSTNYLV